MELVDKKVQKLQLIEGANILLKGILKHVHFEQLFDRRHKEIPRVQKNYFFRRKFEYLIYLINEDFEISNDITSTSLWVMQIGFGVMWCAPLLTFRVRGQKPVT